MRSSAVQMALIVSLKEAGRSTFKLTAYVVAIVCSIGSTGGRSKSQITMKALLITSSSPVIHTLNFRTRI